MILIIPSSVHVAKHPGLHVTHINPLNALKAINPSIYQDFLEKEVCIQKILSVVVPSNIANKSITPCAA
jgi:hypothetical protein